MKSCFYNGQKVSFCQQYKQDGVVNTESDLYFLPCKDELLIFKEFKTNKEDELQNKKAIIESIIQTPELSQVDSLILPRNIVEENGLPLGYIMPFADGITLKSLLSNPDLPFSVKRDALKKVGELLRQLKELRHQTGVDFYLNDIHEDNFLVENGTTGIKALDIDSASINGIYNSLSMYLRPASRLTSLGDKYYLEPENPIYGVQIVPTDNTEIYCYCIMILNFLYGRDAHFISPRGINRYLRYLKYIGIDRELIAMLKRIYTQRENINPVDLIDSLYECDETNSVAYQRFLQKH